MVVNSVRICALDSYRFRLVAYLIAMGVDRNASARTPPLAFLLYRLSFDWRRQACLTLRNRTLDQSRRRVPRNCHPAEREREPTWTPRTNSRELLSTFSRFLRLLLWPASRGCWGQESWALVSSAEFKYVPRVASDSMLRRTQLLTLRTSSQPD